MAFILSDEKLSPYKNQSFRLSFKTFNKKLIPNENTHISRELNMLQYKRSAAALAVALSLGVATPALANDTNGAALLLY